MKRVSFPSRLWVLLAGVTFWVSCHGAGIAVKRTRLYAHPASGLRILKGELVLPFDGAWYVEKPLPSSGSIRDVSLVQPRELLRSRMGKRGRLLEKARQLRTGRTGVSSFWWPLMQYARKHAGALPNDLNALIVESDQLHVKRVMTDSAYPERADLPPPPHYALLEDVKLAFPEGRDIEHAWPTNHEPLLVELHPLFPDGKHFVLFTDRRIRRVDIDVEALAEQGLRVVPLIEKMPPDPEIPEEIAYSVYALAVDDGAGSFRLTNRHDGQTRTVRWDFRAAEPGTLEDAKMWARRSGAGWAHLSQRYDAPILSCWAWLQGKMFGIDYPNRSSRRRRRDRDLNTTNLFNVFGGRAAMRETLQLQALTLGSGEPGKAPPVFLEDIKGVEVTSHPFEEMLDGQAGGRLPLADLVPHDVFFLHVAKPSAVGPMLGDGADFLHRAGAAAVSRSLDYQLIDRYLAKLGMTRPWLQGLMNCGILKEAGVFSPDLFFIDGTEITALARISNAQLFFPMLKLLGVGSMEDGAVTVARTPRGGVVYWGLVRDIFIVSTAEAEVKRVMQLDRNAGAGSLGKSAEFRYMLTQLPLTPETRAYAYFSDPFIRNLVGPRTKIGQLRRLQEVAKLQSVTSAALLHRVHGQSGPVTTDVLREKGYLPSSLDLSGIRLGEGCGAYSETYGTLGDLTAVHRLPLSRVAAAEAKAYKNYRDRYSRFWRRFFDPIAIRLDDTEAGELQITTFILPLVDNSLYNGLREVIAASDETRGMRVPDITPAPVAMLSMQLSENVWVEMLDDFLDEFRRNEALPGHQELLAVVDDLGPSVHIALHDSDPIIAFGSGEMMGLGGSLVQFDDDLLAVPLLISMLTRPTTLAVELQQTRDVRSLLQHGGLRQLLPIFGGMIRINYYRLGDGDSWVYGLSFFGINLRFLFEIQKSYLLIRNLPWGPDVELAQNPIERPDAVELRLDPLQAHQQLAAMFTAAQEKDRRLAMEGLASLYPLVEAGHDVEEALDVHRNLLGYAPAHPSQGKWILFDGRLASTTYGCPGSEKQPVFKPGARFGVLRGVEDVKVNMRFEDEGLRTVVTWKYSAASP